MTAEAQGYDKGPLQGLVKVKVSDIGQSQLFASLSPDQLLMMSFTG